MHSIGRALAVVLAAMVFTSACSRDEEVGRTVADLEQFTDELVKKVKSAQDPSAGVDAAQRYLDEHKADIKGKLAAIKEVRGFQISAATKKKTEETFMKMAQAVGNLMIDNVTRAALDPAFQTKLEKLTTDYRDLIAG